MRNPWLAITEPAPPGFEFCRELRPQDLRRSAFALFAETIGQAEAALQPFRGKVVGVIVTTGQELLWENRGDGIFHLALPPHLEPFLSEILGPQLSALENVLRLSDAAREQTLNLARAAEDRARLVREFGDLRESLLKEIGERRIAQGELQKAHDELEIRVRERTSELAQTNESLEQVLRDQARSHEALKAAQLQLIQAEKMQSVGRLAAGVAHEVKNPLQILSMGLDCLATGDTDPDMFGIVIGEMKEAIGRANEVIGGLLDYSTSKELDIRPGDLNAAVKRALQFLKHELTLGKIEVIRRLDPALACCPFDANKIDQVLITLLENSCHATPENGTITVTTSAPMLESKTAAWDAGDRAGTRSRQDEQMVVVEIKDSGAGISAENLARLFDPFFSTKPTGKGTGLGLAVARKIVELHGGTLQVANIPEGGAQATLMLRVGTNSGLSS